MRNVRIGSAGALIVGFFMPWVSIWGFSLSGYRIPEIAGGVDQFTQAIGGRGDSELLLFYTAYAVPLLALLTLLEALVNKTDEGWGKLLGIITGGVPLAGFVYAMSQVGQDLFKILAIGAYWTLVAAGTLFIAALQIASPPERHGEINRGLENVFGKWRDAVPVVVRAIAGFTFFMYGWQKVFQYGLGGVTDFFRNAGFPLPGVCAFLVSYIELLGGVALLIGFQVRAVALPLCIVMLVALFVVHLPHGFFYGPPDKAGISNVLNLFGYSLVLLILGAGRWSVDTAMHKDR